MSTSNDDEPTLTVVTRSFPPQVSGSAILIANLLASYTGKVHALAGYNQDSKSDPEFQPPCPTRYLVRESLSPRVYGGLTRRFPELMSRLLRGSIRKALTELRTNIVLAAFPSDVFLVAGFLAARELQRPIYVYMHDLWIENKPAGTAAGYFAERWEPVILTEATRVLCMTEAMQEHYEAKYNIKTFLMPHSIVEDDLLRAPVEMRPPRFPKPTVLFVGEVSSDMNLDALRVLASAAELLPHEYELLYCTSFDLATLSRRGIRSSRLQVKYVSRAEVQRLQSSVHVLIAPLSHKNCSEDEVRTVFSTKLLEYLVSGRPIVVFAPKDSYHAKSAQANGWAYVVTEDSPLALAAAIQKVITDQDLSGRLVQGALQEAQRRNAKYHAEQLRNWIRRDAREFAEERFALPACG